MALAISSLNEILVTARRAGASDVHLSASHPVFFRLHGRLNAMTDESCSTEQIRSLIRKDMLPPVVQQFEQTGDAEHVHTIAGQGRFRITLMRQQSGWELTARLIPLEAPTLETIGMPGACANLTKWSQGMVLVTGPAGSGKTTSLAALVEIVNQTRRDHIISIESPIEIVYTPKQCQITQREVGPHSQSQHKALRAALREDPDIIVISELRDLSTIQLAVTAAETGHLVFGTMNTVNAAHTISRLIDSFPSDEQAVMRHMISESLRGVICQQLVPRKDGKGMAAAYEILIVNHSVANLIREGKIAQIQNAMATGKSAGMQLMDSALQSLASTGIISTPEALERALNPATMLQMAGI